MEKILIKSYAKINLYLDVLGKRDDGYHEIETVMQHIDLCDDVLLRWFPKASEKEIRIVLSTNRPYLPIDEKNLAYKAARLILSEAGKTDIGGQLRIDIKKRIPVAAGMAGGSGNGAAVLLGVNRIFGLGYNLQELCTLGAKLGSDVPFCVMGQAKYNKVLGKEFNDSKSASGAALATGTGTDLVALKSLSLPVLITKPPIKVSTKDVYAGIDEVLEEKQLKGEKIQRPIQAEMVKGLDTGDLSLVEKNMVNILELYTLKAHPIIVDTMEKLRKDTNPLKVMMSGSGPTVFALFKDQMDLEKAYTIMRKVNKETFIAKMLD